MSLAISYFVESYFLVSRVCICSFLNIYWSFERLILWMIYCLKTSFKRSPSQNVMNWHHIFWYSALVSEVFSIIIDHLSGWSFEWSFIWKRHSSDRVQRSCLKIETLNFKQICGIPFVFVVSFHFFRSLLLNSHSTQQVWLFGSSLCRTNMYYFGIIFLNLITF